MFKEMRSDCLREDIKKNFSSETMYISSYIRLPENIPSALYNGHIDIGLIINYRTGVIEGYSCTLVTKVTRDFLGDIIVGYNFYENDGVEPLVDIIRYRFNGTSQKCIIAVLRDAYKKFLKWKVDNNINYHNDNNN